MRYISLILSGEIIGYESGKKKVQLTLLWTFHRKRTASSCVSTWRSLMKSDLLGFEVVWWIEKIIFQQLYHYLLFNCLSILNGLLEMPGSCCKFWSHLCFQVQSHLAHSLQPKKCSMKPCIAFSTSLGKKSILHSCKAGLTFKQAQEQWAPISNHQELFETLDLQHELLPGWWSESARDSTSHRGNHHTWPSDRNEYVKRHIYFISTIRILISILIIIFIKYSY